MHERMRKLGERLVARARAVYVGKTQAVCQCEVFAISGGEEKLCAIAQGTIAKLAKPDEKTPNDAPD